MFRVVRISLFFLLLGWPLASLAASVTLEDALLSGLKNNPGYQVSIAQSDAADAAVAEAGSQWLPTLTLSENLVRSNEPGTSLFISLNQQSLELSPSADDYNDAPARTDFETRLQLTQSIYNPDITYAKKQASAYARATHAGQRAGREGLALEIFSAYLEVQQGHAELFRAQRTLEETAEIHRLAQERQHSGTGLKADTLSAAVERADSERQLVAAQNLLLLGQYRLAFLIGSDAQTVDIAEPLSVDYIASPQQSDLSQRADLEALRWQEQAAEAVRMQARAAWLPRVQAAASWSHHDSDYPFSDDANNWTVQAGLNWTLFDGMARSHRSAKALAQEKAVAASYRQAERKAKFEQIEAQLNAATAIRLLETGRLAVVAAEEGYQLMLSRYRNGLATMAALLTVQSQLEKSRADLTTAEIYLIGARAQQHYAAGNLIDTIQSGQDH